ncbi:MAG: tyrosine-type recombinase/integrase [Faecalibacterium sp.]
MASIRKRGNSYLIVVSMGYDANGKRRKSAQKTVKLPPDLTPKQGERWLQEQAILFESAAKRGDTMPALSALQIRRSPQTQTEKTITFADYTAHWFADIAPYKLAKSTIARNHIDLARVLPYIGHLHLNTLRAEQFRQMYQQLRQDKNKQTGEPISESTVEGIHAAVCTVLSSAMEEDYLAHNPAWRTFRRQVRRPEREVANPETLQQLIGILETQPIKYEVFFKLILASGIRRGECCGLKWSDIHFDERKIHIQRNTVKVNGEAIFTKAPKTTAGDRWVYFSPELGTLLTQYRAFCAARQGVPNLAQMQGRYLFQKEKQNKPMSPDTFTQRFNQILRENGLPQDLNVHSLRHSVASVLIANGTDVATVSSLLGHAQVSTTLDIYAHAFDSNKKAASEQLHKGLGV